MTVQDILEDLEKMAQSRLAGDWEAAGLQTGSLSSSVNRIAVALTPSIDVLAKSVDEGVDMLIVHRPLFREPFTGLARDNPFNDCLYRVIAAGISVYVVDPSYDIAPGGPTDILLDLLELPHGASPLLPTITDRHLKIVVFTPPEAVDKVRDAMTDAGAGFIGNYSHCTFMTEGTGTFLPLPGSEPYSGEGIGKLAKEREWRLETIAPEPLLGNVIRAMIDAHPYEEVAYDIYPLANPGTVYGLGRVVDLDKPLTLAELSDAVEEKIETNVETWGNAKRPISRLALFAGPGQDMVHCAADAKADVFLAGDLGINGLEDAERAGIAAIDAPTTDLLMPGVQALYEQLRRLYAEREVEVEML